MLGIWDWNLDRYGKSRADGYVAFLRREIESLADDPLPGLALREGSLIRYANLRQPGRKYWHVVAFEIVDGELKVIDLFHTAQDWRSKLEEF